MAHIPYGYIIEKGRAVPDKEQAPQVQRFFEEYVSGLALQPAADKTGIKRKHVSLGRMIENRLYIGSEFYPAVVDEELWHKAQAERQCRAERLGRNRKYFACQKSEVSPFCGIVFCSECGSEYRPHRDHGTERWKCSGRVMNKRKCNGPIMPEADLEEAFMRLISIIKSSGVTDKPARRPAVIEKKYDDPYQQAEYAYSQTRIDDFDYQTDKLLDALQDPPVDFGGGFMKKIVKRIEVQRDGEVLFSLINDKRFRAEMRTDE